MRRKSRQMMAIGMGMGMVRKLRASMKIVSKVEELMERTMTLEI